MPEIAGVSAGGMPDRVKCLHVLAGQSLAQGRGVNPLGDEVLDALGAWWSAGPCVAVSNQPAGTSMTRVAAFDCGTNSLRLLVADLDIAAGTSRDVVREMQIVRLGQGVDRTGRIAEASLQRVFAAVEEYMEKVRELDVAHLRFCATSAARDAENAEDFVAGIRDRVGVAPEVLDG